MTIKLPYNHLVTIKRYLNPPYKHQNFLILISRPLKDPQTQFVVIKFPYTQLMTINISLYSPNDYQTSLNPRYDH